MDKFVKSKIIPRIIPKTVPVQQQISQKVPQVTQVSKLDESEDTVSTIFDAIIDRTNHELWIEKYRPQKLSDIVGNDKNLEQIHAWFTNFKAKKPGTKRALLLGGAPGLGKTSLAHVILNEYGYQVKEYNASDVRSKKLVQANLDQLINISLVDKLIDENCKPIGIIMDEVDGMSAGDKGGMAELIQFINPNRGKRSVKKEDRELVENRWIPPIICICNSRYDKKILNLKKDCLEIVFQKPLTSDLIQVIDRITKAENFQIEESSKKLIASYAQGDYRRLLFLLQNIYIIHRQSIKNGHKINDQDVISQYQLFCQKEVEMSLYETIDNLLNKKLSPMETLKIYESDKSLLPMMVHENYVNFIACQSAPSVFCQLEEIQDCIDTIIEGDIIDKNMYNNQNWYLQPIHGLNSCFIPSYYINKYPKPQYQKSKFTTALGKFSLHCSNRKNVNNIISAVNGRYSYSVEDIRVLSEIILYKGFIRDAKPAEQLTDASVLVDNNMCVAYLKRYNLTVDDIDKLIKMNKLNPFYKDLNSICRTKTVLKKLYGDVDPHNKIKKTLNKSLSSINSTMMKGSKEKTVKQKIKDDDGDEDGDDEEFDEGDQDDDDEIDDEAGEDETEEKKKPKVTKSTSKTISKTVNKTISKPISTSKAVSKSVAKKPQVAKSIVADAKDTIKLKSIPKIVPKVQISTPSNDGSIIPVVTNDNATEPKKKISPIKKKT